MRRLKADDGEPRAGQRTEDRAGALAHDVALVALEPDGLRQPGAVEPWIVQEEPALESLPEVEASAEFRGDNGPCMLLAHEPGPAVPGRKVPFAEERRRIRALPHLVRDGARTRRERVKVIAQPVCWGWDAGEDGRPRERPEGMGRDGLGEVRACAASASMHGVRAFGSPE
jgi:hypothetical protein